MSNSLQIYGVTFANTIISFTILLSLLWVTPITLYVIGLYHAVNKDQSDTIQVLWSIIVGSYLFSSVLAFLSYFVSYEQLWPIKMLYNGAVKFSIASLPVLAAVYIVDDDLVGIGLSLSAIGSTCLADAALSGIFQELLVRKIQKQKLDIEEVQLDKKKKPTSRRP